MRASDFRRHLQTTVAAATIAIAGVSAPAALSAQQTATPSAPAQTMEVDDDAYEQDDDTDLGWLGLLGLAGLLGLRRRHVHHTTTRVDDTTRRPMV